LPTFAEEQLRHARSGQLENWAERVLFAETLEQVFSEHWFPCQLASTWACRKASLMNCGAAPSNGSSAQRSKRNWNLDN